MAQESPETTYLLVDGNNIVHAWDDLKRIHRQNRGLAQVELCRRLRQLHDAGDLRVVVVFDGRGTTVSEEREPKGLQIIYTDAGRTADDVIERLASRYSGQHRLLVATDDRAEQNMVLSFGAEPISALSLRQMVDASEGKWRDYV